MWLSTEHHPNHAITLEFNDVEFSTLSAILAEAVERCRQSGSYERARSLKGIRDKLLDSWYCDTKVRSQGEPAIWVQNAGSPD